MEAVVILSWLIGLLIVIISLAVYVGNKIEDLIVKYKKRLKQK